MTWATKLMNKLSERTAEDAILKSKQKTCNTRRDRFPVSLNFAPWIYHLNRLLCPKSRTLPLVSKESSNRKNFSEPIKRFLTLLSSDFQSTPVILSTMIQGGRTFSLLEWQKRLQVRLTFIFPPPTMADTLQKHTLILTKLIHHCRRSNPHLKMILAHS